MHATEPLSLPRTSQLVWWPLAALIVLLMASGLAADVAGGGEEWNQVATTLWYLAWGTWVVSLCRRHGIGMQRLIGRPPRRASAWGYAAMGFPLLLLSTGLFWLQLVLALAVTPEWAQEWLGDEPDALGHPSPLTAALDLLGSLALAPVVEELVFRGALLRSWTRRRGRTAALLGTAAIFAVLHPGDLLGTFVFGVVQGVIRLRTRTLLVPIACHVLFNGLTALLSADFVTFPGGTLTMDDMPRLWWVGAVCVAAAAPFLWIFLRLNMPRRRVP
ncbi:MAG: type II CAAX endopeptidase family protein [Longimicrobiaceae bacterium]